MLVEIQNTFVEIDKPLLNAADHLLCRGYRVNRAPFGAKLAIGTESVGAYFNRFVFDQRYIC